MNDNSSFRKLRSNEVATFESGIRVIDYIPTENTVDTHVIAVITFSIEKEKDFI